jgi:urease gamma subunit
MSVKRSPIVSEFETQALADSHDGWFRRKVEESLADARGVVAHDQVMADVEAIISEAEVRRRSDD